MKLEEIELISLIDYSKDGEWGKGYDYGDAVEMYVIRGTDFQEVKEGVYDKLPVRWISRQIAERKKLKEGDVLIELAGGTEDNPTGRTCYISKDFINNSDKPLTVASFSRFIRLDTSKCNSRYIYWLLQYLYKYRILKKYHTQHTGTARFQWTHFANREKLAVHPFKYQRKIASILSAYDELIENNKQRIKLLEEMAEEIYKEWFVRMRFPGYESAKFYNEEGKEVPYGTGGAIPEGWKCSSIGNISYNFDSKRRPLSSTVREQIKGKYPYYGAAKIIDRINKFIFDGKFLLIAEDGSVITKEGYPVLQFVNEKFWVSNHAHILQGIAPISSEYLFLSLKNYPIIGLVTGAAQPKINQENLNRIIILNPKKDICEKFNKIIIPFFDKVKLLGDTNIILQQTRDLLLPRLISGKLSVEHLLKEEENLSMAAEPISEYGNN
ncbi:MAG: restriction endonuclease subunit S [Cytophagaceae bacterium]